jgi:hypothetical protein
MFRTPLIHTLGRLAAVAALLLGLLLAATGAAAAEDDEAPVNVVAFANGPGLDGTQMITVTWDYLGEGVYWFVLEQESPYGYDTPDRDKRVWTVYGLEPNTTYRYRICAVYEFNRVCSDWSNAATTHPRQAPPPPSGSGGSSGDTSPPPAARPAPQPLPSPVIRARPSRLGPGGDVNVHLAWVNPLNAQQHALLTAMDWYRDGVFIASAHTLEFDDVVQANATHRYKLCIENPVNQICSPEISAGPAGVAASLESLNLAGHFIRHRNSIGDLTRLTTSLDFADATFVLRPGLTGTADAVSFESVNYPGHYLRHQNYRIKLSRDDGSDLFRQDATFVVRPGLSGTPGTVSFESVNFPDHFIRHQNFELWLANKNAGNTALFPQDVSFWQTLGRSAWP